MSCGLDLVQEVEGAAAAGALLRAGGGVEQRAHGVEVAVGVAAGRAAAPGGPLQALRPGGAVPQLPQGLLGGAAAREELAGLAQQRAEALGAAGVRRVVRDQPLRLGEGRGEQFVGGRRHAVARRPAPPRAARGRGGAGRRRPCRRGGR